MLPLPRGASPATPTASIGRICLYYTAGGKKGPTRDSPLMPESDCDPPPEAGFAGREAYCGKRRSESARATPAPLTLERHRRRARRGLTGEPGVPPCYYSTVTVLARFLG